MMMRTQSHIRWKGIAAYFVKAMKHYKDNEMLVVPFNTGTHWVTLSISRDDNFTRGCGYLVDIWPDGCGSGCHFSSVGETRTAPWIGGCGRGFHFSPVGDLWISKISNFDGFGLASPPKFLSASKFWSSLTISPTQVSYRNPSGCALSRRTPELSAVPRPHWRPQPKVAFILLTNLVLLLELQFIMASWSNSPPLCSNPRVTQNSFETWRVRAWVRLFTYGCGRWRVWVDATGVAMGSFFCQTCPEPALLPSLLISTKYD
jgi:hypothetical protein